MPGEEMFKAVDLPGKGCGVVAFRDIKRGELILSEEPLIQLPWWIRHSHCPYKEKKTFLENSVRHMDKKKRDGFWSLHDSKVEDGERKTIDGIWRTNNFALGASGPRADNGLFLKISRFNHSCDPTGEFRWNKARGRQEIRAVRDIKAGTELTISYFTYQIAVLSQAERRQFLWDHYGFPCDCTPCSLQGEELRKNDAERREVDILQERIEELFYEYEYSEDEKESSGGSDRSRETDGINLTHLKSSHPANHPASSDQEIDNIDIKLHNISLYNNSQRDDQSDKETKTDDICDGILQHKDLKTSDNKSHSCDNNNDNNDDEEKNAEEIKQGIELCFLRLDLMAKLGFKLVSQLPVCKLIYDTAVDWDMKETATEAAFIGTNLARTLYGVASQEFNFWTKQLTKVAKNQQ